MKLLNELLNLSESDQGTTLVGLTINGKLVTDKTKDEVWDGDFNCYKYPNLISLKGAPKEVTGNFTCYVKSNFVSLEGGPTKVTGNFSCSDNPKLTSLKGAPDEVGGNFNCANNNLSSIEGAPKKIGKNFFCFKNPKITSLKGIHKQITHLDGTFFSGNNPIKSHVLGLLLIKGCTDVELKNKKVQKILNKYLPNTKGNKAVIECQSELIDADLDDFAEL